MRFIPSLLLLPILLAAPAVVAASGLESDLICEEPSACLAAGAAASPAATGEPYYLTTDSAWLEGCIVGQCDCAVRSFDDLTGVFRLAELPTVGPGPWRLFEVQDVVWSYERDGTRIEVRGSGLYQTAAPVLDQQRLILDLELDGEPIATLDSGVVAGGLSFPEIDVEQALTPGICYQEGVQLAAEPVPEPSAWSQQSAGLLVLLLFARWRARSGDPAGRRRAHAPASDRSLKARW